MTGPRRAQRMAEFFDERAGGYDDHMRLALGADFAAFYAQVVRSVTPTHLPIRVLDLGIGTGLELPGRWERAPQAQVTGIDVSRAMLERLRAKYPEWADRMMLVEGDYLALDWPGNYDYIISVMSVHQLTSATKRQLYARMRGHLRAGGQYIEADYMVPFRRGTGGAPETVGARRVPGPVGGPLSRGSAPDRGHREGFTERGRVLPG